MGCGSGILGTLLVLFGMVVYAVVSSLINGVFARARFADTAACALFPLTATSLIVAFVLYEAAFIVWQLKLAKTASDDGDSDGKLKKLSRLVLVLAIALSLLFSVFCANTYTQCGEKSIEKVCFVTTKEYRWDGRCDVLCYNLTCGEDGNATFTVLMKDGEVIDLFGTTNSVSDTFKERFDSSTVGLWSYAAYLAEEFENSGFLIEGRISGEGNLELIKEKSPEAYPYIKSIIDLNKNTDAQ